jgi:hypothetical protein
MHSESFEEEFGTLYRKVRVVQSIEVDRGKYLPRRAVAVCEAIRQREHYLTRARSRRSAVCTTCDHIPAPNTMRKMPMMIPFLQSGNSSQPLSL